MDRLLTGVGDGCDSCVTPRALWTDAGAIMEGFPINRTIEGIRERWEHLPKLSSGEVKRKTGDYAVRQGLCSEPLSKRETFSYTVTHKVSFFFHTQP